MSLTNTQYDEIMRSYQDKQRRRSRIADERRREVEMRDPRIAELNDEMTHLLALDAMKRLSAGQESIDETEQIQYEIDALEAEQAGRLAVMGYPEDYLTPPYDCPDCKDTGYIGSERCHCFKQAAIDLIYGQSHLSRILERECFSRFRLDYYPKDLIDQGTGISAYEAAKCAYECCLQFVKNFDTDYQNLFLFGDTGVGKTFLCNCIAGELIRTGHSVLYFSADRLFDALADHAFGRGATSEADYHEIFDCDLLIIDDLGTEMTNSFTLSQFFVCLNERILQERSTVISSNLGLQDISNIYSERIFSRITSHFALLHLFGKDIRVQQSF